MLLSVEAQSEITNAIKTQNSSVEFKSHPVKG